MSPYQMAMYKALTEGKYKDQGSEYLTPETLEKMRQAMLGKFAPTLNQNQAQQFQQLAADPDF